MAGKNPVEEIAEIISGNDQKVMELIKRCVYNADAYFKDNTSRYEEHGMYIDDQDSYEEEEIPWIGMNDILEDNGYVYEIDSSSYLEDYIDAIESCKAFESNGLSIDEEWFDEEDEMQTWFKVLDKNGKTGDSVLLVLILVVMIIFYFLVLLIYLKSLTAWHRKLVIVLTMQRIYNKSNYYKEWEDKYYEIYKT